MKVMSLATSNGSFPTFRDKLQEKLHRVTQAQVTGYSENDSNVQYLLLVNEAETGTMDHPEIQNNNKVEAVVNSYLSRLTVLTY